MSDPFRVAPELHTVPGALPPATFFCPFRTTRNESVMLITVEKSRLASTRRVWNSTFT